MKKRWLKLAAIGIMAGTLVVQAPVVTYAGERRSSSAAGEVQELKWTG